MTPDPPPSPRAELEARLTALLLGELSADESAALRQTIANDPALAFLLARLERTIPMVRETAATPAPATAQPAPLKLSDHRRQQLLAHFKTVAPKEFAAPSRREPAWMIQMGIAAALVALVGVWLLLPSLAKSKNHSVRVMEQMAMARKQDLADESAITLMSPPGTRVLPASTSAPAAPNGIYSINVVGFTDVAKQTPPPASKPAAANGTLHGGIGGIASSDLAVTPAEVPRPAKQPEIALPAINTADQSDHSAMEELAKTVPLAAVVGGSAVPLVSRSTTMVNQQNGLSQSGLGTSSDAPTTSLAPLGSESRLQAVPEAETDAILRRPARPAQVAAAQPPFIDPTTGLPIPANMPVGTGANIDPATGLPLATASPSVAIDGLAAGEDKRTGDTFDRRYVSRLPWSGKDTAGSGGGGGGGGGWGGGGGFAGGKPAAAATPPPAAAPTGPAQLFEQEGLADRQLGRGLAEPAIVPPAAQPPPATEPDSNWQFKLGKDVETRDQNGRAEVQFDLSVNREVLGDPRKRQRTDGRDIVVDGDGDKRLALGDVPMAGALFDKSKVPDQNVQGLGTRSPAGAKTEAKPPINDSFADASAQWNLGAANANDLSLAYGLSTAGGVSSVENAGNIAAYKPAATEPLQHAQVPNRDNFFYQNGNLDGLSAQGGGDVRGGRFGGAIASNGSVTPKDYGNNTQVGNATITTDPETHQVLIATDGSDLSKVAAAQAASLSGSGILGNAVTRIDPKVMAGLAQDIANLNQAAHDPLESSQSSPSSKEALGVDKDRKLELASRKALVQVEEAWDVPLNRNKQAPPAATVAATHVQGTIVTDGFQVTNAIVAQPARDLVASGTFLDSSRAAALGKGTTQVDVLESGRETAELVARELSQMKRDSELRKTTMVTVVDKAEPAPAESPTLLGRMKHALTGEYVSKARVKAERDVTDIAGVDMQQTRSGVYDPHFAQTESEVIQSEPVLNKVIKDLKLDEKWANKSGSGGKLDMAETRKLLKKSLDLRQTPNTTVLEIGVKSKNAEEAALIANTVAKEYANLRETQRQEVVKSSIQGLEKQLAEIEKKDAVIAGQLPRQSSESKLAQADAPLPKLAPTAAIPQPEVPTAENAFSTFSLNIADVSFKLAAASLEKGVMPDPATVRSEEFLNAFDYRDPEPSPGAPLGFAWERARDPFAQNRDLLRFSVKTAAAGRQPGRPLNLVLLLDNSGSMERADRVEIIHEALRVLGAQLQAQDKFSVVTFARTPRLWVDGVPGDQAPAVAEQVSGLTPQGGTNLEDAMKLAYETAQHHYLSNGVNRVVLLTDGAANLGSVDPVALKQRVEAQRKQGIALDCFGIGWEGYNDDLLEVLSRNGDGRYGFINTPAEAANGFAAQLAGALHVAAADVKVQIEFNPKRVTAYRQIGYAKHQLTKEQFRDNTVDAAEIGAAESGNALYVVEVNPAGEGPLGTVRVRYKVPGTTDYPEHAWDVPYAGNAPALEQSSDAMRLAATASAFAEWLVSSPFAAEVTPDRLLGYLAGVPEACGADQRPKNLEWMIRQSKSISGK